MAKAAPARRRTPLAGVAVTLAVLIALAPAVLWAVGVYGGRAGLVSEAASWTARAWAPQIAMASGLTSLLAVVAAFIGGFRRYWLPAAVAVAVSAATLAAMFTASAPV